MINKMFITSSKLLKIAVDEDIKRLNEIELERNKLKKEIKIYTKYLNKHNKKRRLIAKNRIRF